MTLALLILITIFLFIISFAIGYILGKGKIEILKSVKVNPDIVKKQEEEFDEMLKKYNETINEIAGFGDIDGL